MKRIISRSEQGKPLLSTALLFTLLASYLCASQASAEGGDHHRAYLDALDTVTAVEARIGEEMTRISNGSVAHYDFLQHEHIELLRHARALRHPPTDVSAAERDAVLAQADALLMVAETLELVIADFLRAQALLGSAVSNTLDLIATQANQGLSDTELTRLRQLDEAAREFRTDNSAATREALDAAFDRVASLEIGQTWHRELSVQRVLIRNNAAEADAGLAKLARAGVGASAKELRGVYVAAH